MPYRTIRVAAALIVAFVALSAGKLPAASTCEWNGIERVVAVGDVHGAYDRFVEILKVAGIVDGDLRWAGGRTHVVQLGDLVDRGDDSRKALDLVRRLERPAQAAGGAWHQLLGNHEVARMLGDLRLVRPAEYAAFANVDSVKTRESYLRTLGRSAGDRSELIAQMPLGFVEMRQAFGREGEYGRWLRQLPVAIKIDGVLFVHGGISPPVAPLGCEAINEQVTRELTSDIEKTRANALASLSARADGPLWYRGLVEEPDTTFAPELTDILSKQQVRAIVVGHTVAPLNRITTRFDGRVVEIDTGMQPAYIQDGRASALEIRGSEATAIYVDRRDPVELPRREGSTPQPVPVR
jgi:Calcineurin-like phosphoesterase